MVGAVLIKRLPMILCIFGFILMAVLVTPHVTVQATTLAYVVSSTSYLDGLGWYNVVGEVKNVADGALEFIQITATFYDVNNVVVGTRFSYAYIEVLEAGRKSPFTITLGDAGQSAEVHHYSLMISSFEQTTSKPVYLQISSMSAYTDSNRDLHLIGEIENSGTQIAQYVRIVATFYGGDGEVVGAAVTYSDPKDIAPLKKATFDVSPPSGQTPLVKSYALEAQPSEYNLIPEFQNPLLILILGIIIAILATRKPVGSRAYRPF
jgi:hypothetical protein